MAAQGPENRFVTLEAVVADLKKVPNLYVSEPHIRGTSLYGSHYLPSEFPNDRLKRYNGAVTIVVGPRVPLEPRDVDGQNAILDKLTTLPTTHRDPAYIGSQMADREKKRYLFLGELEFEEKIGDQEVELSSVQRWSNTELGRRMRIPKGLSRTQVVQDVMRIYAKVLPTMEVAMAYERMLKDHKAPWIPGFVHAGYGMGDHILLANTMHVQRPG